jgi:type IV secretory pathway VirB10-like protein
MSGAPSTSAAQEAAAQGHAVSAADAQPPGRLGGRSVKRLNRMSLVLAGSTMGVVVLGLAYVFWLLQGDMKQKPQREVEEGHTADIADIMKNAPPGGVIPPNSGTPAPSTDVAATALPPVPLPSHPEPGMTHVEIEGRRQLWTSYFQALDSARQKHLTAEYDALAADTGSASTKPGQAGGQGDADSQLTGGERQSGVVASNGNAPFGAGSEGGQGRQDQGQGFFDQAGATADTDYLQATVTDPVSPYELKAADIIEARMISGLTSDSHGIVRAVVSKNVYDHATGLHIVVPQGSQLVGIYNTGVAYGQKRVEVAWQRVIYPAPCDQSLDLGQMPGSDQSGFSGFHDITDNHYAQIFLNALLLSGFSAGAQVSQQGNYSRGGGYNAGQVAAGAMGQQLTTLGEEFARRGLDIPPTETVRNGYPFTIMVTKDIAFAQPWVAGQCRGQEVSIARR